MSASEEPSASLVKDLQRALNAARKAESRVKRVATDRQTKRQQWLDWEREVKKKYMSEKKRHQSDLEGLDREMQSALAAQKAARETVRKVAASQSMVDAMGLADEAPGDREIEQLRC